MASKSIQELDRIIAEAQQQKERLVERRVDIFSKAIMKSKARNSLAELTEAQVKQVARSVADGLDSVIKEVMEQTAAQVQQEQEHLSPVPGVYEEQAAASAASQDNRVGVAGSAVATA